MTQDDVVQIVLSCEAGFRTATRQQQYNQVRFFGPSPEKSINIGYSLPQSAFVAVFVFMGQLVEENAESARAFVRLFCGEIPNRPTTFVRLKPPFASVSHLKQLIQAYAAIRPVAGA